MSLPYFILSLIAALGAGLYIGTALDSRGRNSPAKVVPQLAGVLLMAVGFLGLLVIFIGGLAA